MADRIGSTRGGVRSRMSRMAGDVKDLDGARRGMHVPAIHGVTGVVARSVVKVAGLS
jgi:hypothetical protein